jgi:hypothetical protein
MVGLVSNDPADLLDTGESAALLGLAHQQAVTLNDPH